MITGDKSVIMYLAEKNIDVMIDCLLEQLAYYQGVAASYKAANEKLVMDITALRDKYERAEV